MVRRRDLPGEVIELYSPIGLLPIDTFSGTAPIGRLSAFLDARDENGNWRETDIKEVRTPGEIITYPGLGRSADALSQPERFFRVRIEAEFYQPFYRLDADGIEFSAHPYNDANPPKDYPKNSGEFPDYLKKVLKKVLLAPGPNYPFPDHVRVLRGAVIDKQTKEPAVDVEVAWGNKEKTLTTGPPVASDDGKKSVPIVTKGVFALPLRITEKDQLNKKLKIDALDHRTGRTGEIEIEIPKDLGKNHIISIEQ
jgi:hypothetical protein